MALGGLREMTESIAAGREEEKEEDDVTPQGWSSSSYPYPYPREGGLKPKLRLWTPELVAMGVPCRVGG